LCIEIVKEYNKNIVTNNRREHIIAHTEFSQTWEEHQVRHKEKTSPCHHVREDRDYFFIVFQKIRLMI
jgi:hypothetical protein